MPSWAQRQEERKGMIVQILKFLFEKRNSSMRLGALLPALIALLFVGHAYEDAGVLGATPYAGIIILSIICVFRPMMILWAPVFIAFVAYFVVVALHPQNGTFGEWVIFMLLGLVPAVLLWLARPHRKQKGITTGCSGSASPYAEP